MAYNLGFQAYCESLMRTLLPCKGPVKTISNFLKVLSAYYVQKNGKALGQTDMKFKTMI